VAAHAQLGRRSREAVVVAALARHLADVGDMTGAGRDGAIARGDLVGRAIWRATTTHDEREPEGEDEAEREVASGDDQPACHGRDPIGWQSRHGSAFIGTRDDHPGGCGLPPTPPTL